MRWSRRASSEVEDAAPPDTATPPAGSGLPRLLQPLPPESHDQMRALLGGRELPRGVWWRLQVCVTPRLYDAQLRPDQRPGDWPETPTVAQVVQHYLEGGAADGRRLSVWFNPAWYARELALRDEQVPDGVDPFVHWLTWGWDHRVIATPLFDEDFYASSHPALAADYEHWLFRHFVTRGAYGPGYLHNVAGPFHRAAEAVDDEMRSPLLLDRVLERSEGYDLGRTSWLEEGIGALMARRAALLSPAMKALVDKAAVIEPTIGRTSAAMRSVTMPLHWHPLNLLFERAEAARKQLPVTTCDALVLVSDLSDRVWAERARAAAEALATVQPGAEVLLVATSPAEGAFDTRQGEVDLGEQFAGLGTVDQTSLLRDVVVGLGPTRVVNAGSALGWDLFAGFSRQLATRATLIGWLSDSAPNAPEVEGLPAWAGHLTLALAPSEAAVDTLAHHYLLPAELRSRFVSAPTRVEELADLFTMHCVDVEVHR